LQRSLLTLEYQLCFRFFLLWLILLGLKLHKYDLQKRFILGEFVSVQMQFGFESIHEIFKCYESSANFIVDFNICGFAIPWEYLIIQVSKSYV